MNNLNDLWQKRLTHYLKEVGKYGRLIFNDHLAIILFALFGFGSIAYQTTLQRLTTLSDGHEAFWIILIGVILLSIVFLLGEPLWLTRRSDESYLFPRGHEFDNYWLKGTLLAEIGPMIALSLTAVLYFPFLTLVTTWTRDLMWLFIVYILLARLMSSLLMYLNIYGLGLNITLMTRSRLLLVVPYAVFVLSLMVLPINIMLFVLGGLLALIGAYVVYGMNRRSFQRINFDYVIEMDALRESHFYRLASLFADVPSTEPMIKRRAYLDIIFNKIQKLNNNRYGYLYIRQLFRNTFYSSIWLKVMLFTLVVISMLNHAWLIAIAGCLGFIMTVIQFLPMIHVYDKHPLQIIYPHRTSEKVLAFQWAVFIIMGMQCIAYTVMALFVLGLRVEFIYVLLIWLITVGAISYIYIPWWQHRNERRNKELKSR